MVEEDLINSELPVAHGCATKIIAAKALIL
jgi:hypothetical protein